MESFSQPQQSAPTKLNLLYQLDLIDKLESKKMTPFFEEDREAIDEGFDFNKFPSLKPEQQIQQIPKKFLEQITIADTVKTRSHGCQIKKHPTNHCGTWACDKVKGAKTCLSGIKGFYQSKGIDGWRCVGCDFDMCIKCMQADHFISLHESRED